MHLLYIYIYIYIANSSWHWGSYGSIWTGPSPKQYYMDRSCWGPYNIFWVTELRSIYFFGDGSVYILPYDPKWHELFAILYFLSKIIIQVPVHITLYWPAALTKTNRENKNVKYNIYIYENDHSPPVSQLTRITRHISNMELTQKYKFLLHCENPVQQNFSDIRQKHVAFQWDDNDAPFVLD